MANNKIKVTGRAQNSTALGIVHAYIQMFPKRHWQIYAELFQMI